MRIRTGHGPDDWTKNEALAPAPIRDWFRATGALKEPRHVDVTSERNIRHPKPVAACAITERCRHRPCVARRVNEAKRLALETNLTLSEIGLMMGGRDHSTVSYWLREYQDKDAA